jgi:GDP-4-dehydro-6-deoxy-D-mannose reductase
MRVLITGVTGFVGGHLAERLLREGGHDVAGVARRPEWPEHWRHLAGSVALHAVDWDSAPTLVQLLRRLRPEWVFHLAGYAHNGHSFHDADAAWAGNLQTTRTLYDSVARWGGSPRILFASTGLVYGEPDGPEALFDERSPLKPASPYAASKAAADLLSYQAVRHPGLDIVRVRAFNHTGPKQSTHYVAPNFARQIAGIQIGKLPPVVETGDLSGRRDLTDVRDMVRAYVLLLERGERGEVYNAASGQAYRIEEILDRLIALAGVRVEARQTIDPERRGETVVSRGDFSKLRRATGWAPEYTLDQTLADMLADWRQCHGRLRARA